jgi:NAD(P)-dependent dehydrogenase (short-subunit alcohol dehydrogenase family)
MTDVACFCGCFFSFDGGAGACPKCGEVASVTGLPVLESSGCNRPETPDAESVGCPRYPVPASGHYRLDQKVTTRAGVTDGRAAADAITALCRQLGPIDLLVNKAGVGGPVGGA